MCRRRPRGRARSRAPNNMPSAVLVLLRTPGNKFFEKPTHAHKACKSATFSHRHLHSAIRRRRACRRKAGTLMEFRPPSRLCGDPLDIRHKAGEKSTRARDPNKLQRTDSWTGLVRRHPGPQPNLNLYTRSLQSRAAMPLIPSSPKWRRPGQAARAQSSESPTEIPEASGEGEKIQFIAKRAIRGNPRRIRESFLDLSVNAFLKCCNASVVTQPFGREWVRRGEFVGAANAAIPLRVVHFRAAELRRSCSYHVSWCFLAQARDTSPRMTEPKAPRSIAVPI